MIKKFFTVTCFVACAAWLVSFQSDDLAKSIKRGEEVYTTACMMCHMQNGEGMEGVYPPLAKADYLKKDQKHLISIILKGQSGEIKVNGKKYNVNMPALSHLTDQQIADVLNYSRNTWKNKGKMITEDMVKKERETSKDK